MATLASKPCVARAIFGWIGSMNRLVNNLFVKIFLTFWGILVITAVITIGLIKLTNTENMEAPDWAVRTLHNAAKRIEADPLSITPRPNREFQRRFGRPFLINEQGVSINTPKVPRHMRRFIATNDQIGVPKLSIIEHRGGEPRGENGEPRNNQLILFGPISVEISGQDYLFYLERPVSPTSAASLRRLAVAPELIWGVAILLSIGLCMLLTRHLVRPLKQLQSAANQVSLGHLDTPLPEFSRGDEIGRLSGSLNRMVVTLHQAIENQRRLLSDISHELRSPLTRLNMALALHKKRQGEATSEVQRIEREAQRLEQMIAALLSLSRMQINAQQQHLKLEELLSPLTSDCQFEAEQLGKQFFAHYPQGIALIAYPELLSSAIENICRNALKYAESTVRLTLEHNEFELSLTVSDDGPGLPSHELENIFRPFYRSNEARDRDSGGVGLGLAIAESAIRQHGGQIAASNGEDKGLEVTIRLPLK